MITFLRLLSKLNLLIKILRFKYRKVWVKFDVKLVLFIFVYHFPEINFKDKSSLQANNHFISAISVGFKAAAQSRKNAKYWKSSVCQ